ncbi:uncharacterized protein LOC141857411 [Brevipalpus obovatus]|uniref:uncharacterized protein LOC141857411 n=1 Tax=Brevipalpus obovatus TaxID=246614 RepID=UPI003D9F51D5
MDETLDQISHVIAPPGGENMNYFPEIFGNDIVANNGDDEHTTEARSLDGSPANLSVILEPYSGDSVDIPTRSDLTIGNFPTIDSSDNQSLVVPNSLVNSEAGSTNDLDQSRNPNDYTLDTEAYLGDPNYFDFVNSQTGEYDEPVPGPSTVDAAFEAQRREYIERVANIKLPTPVLPLLSGEEVGSYLRFVEDAFLSTVEIPDSTQHGGSLSIEPAVPVSPEEVLSPNISKRPHDEIDDNQPSSNSKKRYVEIDSLPMSHTEPELIFTKLNDRELPYNPNFHRRQWETTFSLQHNLSSFADLTTVSTAIDSFYQNFMSYFLDEAMPTDRVTVSISHHSINPPIYINFLRKDFDREAFSKRLNALAQSSRDLLSDGEINIVVRLVKNIGGQGYAKRKVAPSTANERTVRKKSIIELKNRDNLCGLRAIVLGKLMVDEYDTFEKRKQTSWHTKKRAVHENGFFRTKALDICRAIGLDPEGSLRVSDLPRVQQHLGQQYRIIVVNCYNLRKVFASPPAPKLICLELYPDDSDGDTGHYNLITKLPAYFDRYYMCVDCWLPSNSRNHLCPTGCKQCYSTPACQRPVFPAQGVDCNTCSRTFFSPTCFDNHKSNGLCEDKKRCKKCKVEFFTSEKHKCFIYRCTRCGKEYEEGPHYCFLSPFKEDDLRADDMVPKALVFFDIESTQKMVDGRLTHFPNLLVSETVCDACYDFGRRNKDRHCDICGGFQSIFYGDQCIAEFNNYILNDLAKKIAIKKGNVLVVAHNSKGYDSHFIFRDIFSRRLVDVQPILNGNKILKIDLNNVRIMDSLSFFPQALESLPKSFGLDTSVIAKGNFPHLFSTQENQDYVGKMPDLEYFSPQLMKENKRAELFAWYNENKHRRWSLKEELIKYCANDVLILRMCVMEYRCQMKKMTGFDPFTRCFTIASVAMEIFRAKMLPGSFMAITPPKGYSGRHNSNEGCAWLDMVEINRKIILRREYRIGNYFVDGFCKETGQVFEYHGCYFHGCPMCYPDETMLNAVSQKQMGELYRESEEKKRYLTSNGYKMVCFWSHDVENLSESSREIFDSRKKYYKKLQEKGHLVLRDAFYGGRTNNISFMHECAEDEQIRYVDFTSLYPYVLKVNMFPYGHPKVLRRDFDFTLQSYFGFVRCIVLPPRDLFIPVLPVKSDGKLVFHLCSKCCNSRQQTKCEHQDSEREILGTWTTPELLLAIDEGYQIVDIIEVYNYDRPNQNIFCDYVDTFMKIKQEKSGFPAWVHDDQDKEKYVKEYKDKEGISLDMKEICVNTGHRTMMKLLLNSLWGKFAIKNNPTKTELITDFSKYWSLLNNGKIQIQSEYSPTDDTVLLQYKFENDEDDEDFAVRNIAVAAFVTSYARIKLYKLIQEIESVRQGRVLYFDTDSVIFVEKDADPKIKTGDYLGELTDELVGYGEGAKCKRFTSAGPKNYGYEVHLPNGETKVSMKTKGIRLSAQALEMINFQKMLEMANKYAQGEKTDLQIPQFRIRSTTASHIVYSETIEKIYRVVSDKRRLDGISTLPYGYCSR